MDDLPLGLKNVPDQMLDSYHANYAAHRKGIKQNEVIQYYNRWAKQGNYENDLNADIYHGPSIAAEYVKTYFTEDRRPYVKVIDVAAGTGQVGVQLHKNGFRSITALDPCTNMLELARRKQVYEHFICDTIGNHKTNCEDGTYDCAVVSGGMGEGHIPVDGLHEMARIVKQGGYVVIAMRREYLDYVEEYTDRLIPRMENMQSEGIWEILEKKIVSNYSFGKDGMVFVFKIKQKFKLKFVN